MQKSLNNYFNVNKKRIALDDKSEVNIDKKNNLPIKLSSQVEKEKAEDLLKSFDLNPKYGPCRGISRIKRYQNAVRLNLNPPFEVNNLIEKYDLNTSFYDKNLI
jgi:hypothetical protein